MAQTRELLQSLAEGRASWGIPWPCVHEFLSIVTHPRIYEPPSSVDAAIDQVDAWLESPVAELLGESDAHWEVLRGQLRVAQIQGPMVHDARVGSICIGHGVNSFWTGPGLQPFSGALGAKSTAWLSTRWFWRRVKLASPCFSTSLLTESARLKSGLLEGDPCEDAVHHGLEVG